ncbi:MAG: MAPEG family protein [Rhizobiaceae bacterium]
MEAVAPYSLALIALLVFVVVTLFQSAFVGAKKAGASLTAGSVPEADYGSAVYRINRAHQNAVENAALIAIALAACIAAGVSAWWVNVLMGLFLLFRLLHTLFLVMKIGGEVQSLRTFAYVASWAMNLILAIMAIYALL